MVEEELVEILLVEDNPNDVELTLRAFKKHNLSNKVHVVSDGEAALDFVFCTGAYSNRDFKKPPKIILLDLKLPKIAGKEVLQRIKSDERTKIIPVVVMTSSHEDRDLEECDRLGVNSYVVKPVEFDAFSKVVADLGFYWLLVNKTG